MSNRIEKVASPVLPITPETFNRGFHDRFINVLRLFFNRIVYVLDNLTSTSSGGRFLYFPNGLFYSTVDQDPVAIDTPYAITYNNTYLSSDVSVVDGSKVTVNIDGIYNFSFRGQADKHSANVEQLVIWIRKNGVDVDNSSKIFGIDEPIDVKWVFNIDMVSGDYIQIMWGVSDLDIHFHAYPASSPYPASPSAVMAVSFVSNV